jgi:hypothetical protein
MTFRSSTLESTKSFCARSWQRVMSQIPGELCFPRYILSLDIVYPIILGSQGTLSTMFCNVTVCSIFCRRMLRLVFHHWCKGILWYCRWMTWCFRLYGNLSIGMLSDYLMTSLKCHIRKRKRRQNIFLNDNGLPGGHNFFPAKSQEVEGIV